MHIPARRRPEFDEAQYYEYPEHLRAAISDMPAAPGVYIFHGEEGDLPLGVLDELNQRYGCGTVKLASAGIQAMGERASWAMRQERRSPAYTTCWEDMPEVVC